MVTKQPEFPVRNHCQGQSHSREMTTTYAPPSLIFHNSASGPYGVNLCVSYECNFLKNINQFYFITETNGVLREVVTAFLH